MGEKERKVDGLIENTIKNLSSFIDVNSVVGTPIVLGENNTIIPISKVTMGFLTGGGEYSELKAVKKESQYPFAGGNGAVVSVKPSGFLSYDGKNIKLISCGNEPFDKLLNIADDFLSKFNNEEQN